MMFLFPVVEELSFSVCLTYFDYKNKLKIFFSECRIAVGNHSHAVISELDISVSEAISWSLSMKIYFLTCNNFEEFLKR